MTARACTSICLSVYVCLCLSVFDYRFMLVLYTRGWSQVVSGLVLRLRGGEVILQEGLQVLERVPLVGLPPPALHHQFMERAGAARGTGHPVAPLHLLQHLAVVHAYSSGGGMRGECGGDLTTHTHRLRNNENIKELTI